MTMSLVASFMSAITLLGTPKEVYVAGTQYCALVLSYPLVMAASAYWYMPVFYKLNVSTSYEVSRYHTYDFFFLISSGPKKSVINCMKKKMII